MDKITVINLLKNSGLENIKMDMVNDVIYFQDPSCIFPAFDTIFHYAWIVIVILTAILLFGWGVLYIKNGVKIDTLFNNAKTLILVLCGLSVVKPIVNVIYGDDLFAKQCETRQVSLNTVQELLDMRKKKFGKSDQELLYENFEVFDTGVIFDSQTESQPSETTDNVNTSGENSTQSTDISNSDFVSVQNQSGSVVYVKSNGEKIKRSGGTLAWRNNNPGNIIAGQFSRSHGAIGANGRFAVFPDESTGMRAITSLLRSNSYSNLSIKNAIHRWAPAADNNDPARYTQTVAKLTGLSPDRTISSLSDAELQNVANAIRRVEGWKPGQEQKI